MRNLIIACLLLPFAAKADGVARLQNFYDQTHALRAHFHQIVTDKKGQKIQEVQGEMQLKRPDKFKWDYKKPYEQQIVSDGKQVWLYDTELAQVSVREVSKALGASPAAVLAGDDSLYKNFKIVNAYRKGDLEWISAQPKAKESEFEKIWMGFNGNNVQELDLIDNFGHQTHIVFSNFEQNPVLDEKTFLFVPPKGVDVVGE